MSKNNLILIIFLAFLLRFFALIALSISAFNLNAIFPDAEQYQTIAINIASGQGAIISNEEQCHHRAPGYPFFLAIFYFLFKDYANISSLIGQIILSLITIFFIYRLTDLVFDRKAGVYAALIAALEPMLIGFTVLHLSETLLVFLLCFALISFAKCLDTDSEFTLGNRHFLLLAAISFALLMLTRQSFFLYPIFMAIFVFFFSVQRRQILRKLVYLLIGSYFLIIPWALRNYFKCGAFIPIATGLGWTLYESNNLQSEGGPMTFAQLGVEDKLYTITNPVERDRYFLKKGLQFIIQHPFKFLSLAVKRECRLLSPFFNSPEFKSQPILSLIPLFFIPLVILACFGLAFSDILNERVWLLLSVVAYIILVHLFFVGSIRYRTPMLPILIVFAGKGLAVGLELLGKRSKPT